MITHFVECTDGWLYGKFLLCRLDTVELSTRSEMPDAKGLPLHPTVMNHAGRRRFNDHSTLVVDLQRGTGAAWPLDGYYEAYWSEHLAGLPVCPLYRPFIEWLYAQGRWGMGAGNITDVPRYIDLNEFPIDVEATRYQPGEDTVIETTETITVPFRLHPSRVGLYINAVAAPQGFPADRLDEVAERGWSMQVGTPPVKIEGEWGGRNYPRYWVTPAEAAKLRQWFAPRVNAYQEAQPKPL